MKRICIFCGSSPGTRQVYSEAARELGHMFVKTGIDLVYGGASVGLMGILARTVLDGGGRVTGVIPRMLAEKEVALTRLDDLRVVESMHERKALMAELSDGFIALPGGIGTIEEFIEVLTWSQLGIHDKPCGLLNIDGYYDRLLSFLGHMAKEGFIRPECCMTVLVAKDPAVLLMKMNQYRSPKLDKADWALKLSNV
ncbi:MAG: TIGR00730 family Rossman fold protein [Geobacteraceae bacterium]|nr:TIGR00730 family Rossman fold protein [Geobacteraceae bacterium]